MNIKNAYQVILILFFTLSCRPQDGISVVGLDEKGNEIATKIDKNLYQREVVKYLDNINAAVDSLSETKNENWDLTKIEVGILLSAGLNAGPIWKFNYSAGQKIIFTKN